MRRIQRNGMECNAMQYTACHGFRGHGTFYRSHIVGVLESHLCRTLHGISWIHAPVPRLRNTKRTSGMAQDDAHSVTYRWKLEDRHRTMIVCAAGNIAPSRSCSAMLFYCERSVFRDPPKK